MFKITKTENIPNQSLEVINDKIFIITEEESLITYDGEYNILPIPKIENGSKRYYIRFNNEKLLLLSKNIIYNLDIKNQNIILMDILDERFIFNRFWNNYMIYSERTYFEETYGSYCKLYIADNNKDIIYSDKIDYDYFYYYNDLIIFQEFGKPTVLKCKKIMTDDILWEYTIEGVGEVEVCNPILVDNIVLATKKIGGKLMLDCLDVETGKILATHNIEWFDFTKITEKYIPHFNYDYLVLIQKSDGATITYEYEELFKQKQIEGATHGGHYWVVDNYVFLMVLFLDIQKYGVCMLDFTTGKIVWEERNPPASVKNVHKFQKGYCIEFYLGNFMIIEE